MLSQGFGHPPLLSFQCYKFGSKNEGNDINVVFIRSCDDPEIMLPRQGLETMYLCISLYDQAISKKKLWIRGLVNYGVSHISPSLFDCEGVTMGKDLYNRHLLISF